MSFRFRPLHLLLCAVVADIMWEFEGYNEGPSELWYDSKLNFSYAEEPDPLDLGDIGLVRLFQSVKKQSNMSIINVDYNLNSPWIPDELEHSLQHLKTRKPLPFRWKRKRHFRLPQRIERWASDMVSVSRFFLFPLMGLISACSATVLSPSLAISFDQINDSLGTFVRDIDLFFIFLGQVRSPHL